MKKKLVSLVIDVLMAAMILWGMINPMSAAVNFVAVWALLGCLVSLGADFTGALAHKHWLSRRMAAQPVDESIMKLLRGLICKTPSKGRQVWGLLKLAFTFSCLVGAGWIFTALTYLICMCFFKVVRMSCRQSIEEAGLCPESL